MFIRADLCVEGRLHRLAMRIDANARCFDRDDYYRDDYHGADSCDINYCHHSLAITKHLPSQSLAV